MWGGSLNFTRSNLFFRSGAIESSHSGVEQGHIHRLAQIPQLLRRHREIKNWENPNKKTKTLKIKLVRVHSKNPSQELCTEETLVSGEGADIYTERERD